MDADGIERLVIIQESLTVQSKGRRQVNRRGRYHNQGVILAIGYLMRSPRVTPFR